MSELSVGQLRGLTVNDNVITMPSGHKLYAPGSVVQVVSVNYSTVVVSTSTSYATTGLNATITPSSTSSKIAIFASTTARMGNNFAAGIYTIFRGTVAGTDLAPAPGSFGLTSVYNNFNGETLFSVATHVLDSPSTTSQQTYTLAHKIGVPGGGVTSQFNSTQANMILMEIAQ